MEGHLKSMVRFASTLYVTDVTNGSDLSLYHCHHLDYLLFHIPATDLGCPLQS